LIVHPRVAQQEKFARGSQTERMISAMRYLLAILLPFVAVMSCDRILLGLALLILQVTVIGWLPAAIVALFVVNNFYADRRVRQYAQMMPTSFVPQNAPVPCFCARCGWDIRTTPCLCPRCGAVPTAYTARSA
jgi:hypothetical protein